MAIVLTMLAMAVPTAAPEYEPKHKGCNTPMCDQRVTAKIQIRRALKKARHDARRRRVTAPYQGWLARTRACECRGRAHPYITNTGNGFYGAYQFTISSWYAAGGRGMPHQAEKLEQDYRAVRLLHIQGRGAWPVCG